MHKCGQSIIEYILIAVLVIFGVVIMGPYVLRSVNAHFQLWNDGVQDAFEETLIQAPVNDIPPISTTCSCIDSPGACGSVLAGSQCGPNQRANNHNCNPQFCDEKPASSCNNDPTCCTTWVDVGCGSYACPPGGCATAPTTPPSSNNCYFGQQIQSQQCGTNTTIQCVPNSSCPLPGCQGKFTQDPALNLFCATNTIDPPAGLNQNYPITYGATCPVSGATCQLYCVPPNVLNQGTCVSPTTPPVQCGFTGGGNNFTGTWTGSYSGNVQNNSCGNIYITMACNSNSTLGGICITAGQPCSGNSARGTNTLSCEASSNSIACSGSMTFYWEPGNGGTCANGGGCSSCQSGNNTCSPSFTINCSSGQLGTMIDNNPADPGVGTITAAPINGCNWSGSVDIRDFGTGNDMHLTCSTNASGQGVLTLFQYQS